MASEAYERVAQAHAELKESIGAPPDTGTHELDRTMSREPRTTVPEDTLRSLGEQLLRPARRLRAAPQAAAAARAPPRGARGRRPDRLGARGGARVRLAAGARRARAAHRPGLGARHVQPAPRGAARREDRRALQPAPAPARRERPVRAAQQPAVRAGLHGLRVRLQRPGPRRARALGGAVRRLREQRPGDHRPVPRVGPRQVGPDLAAHAAAAARLRGLGAGALERARRALPPGRGRGQHPRGELHHARAVLPPAAPPGARLEAAPADRDDAEEPAAAAGRHVHARRARRRPLPARHRRPALRRRRPRGGDEARALLGQDLLRHRRATRSATRRSTSRSRAWSCSTRSPRRTSWS